MSDFWMGVVAGVVCTVAAEIVLGVAYVTWVAAPAWRRGR